MAYIKCVPSAGNDFITLTIAVTSNGDSHSNGFVDVPINVKGVNTIRVVSNQSYVTTSSNYKREGGTTTNFPSTNFTIDVSDDDLMYFHIGNDYNTGAHSVTVVISAV